MAIHVGHTLQTPAQLRDVLVSIRKQRKLSQAALAAQLGITQQSYAQMEANPMAASVERLYRVLRLLGVELRLTYSISTPAQAQEPPAPAVQDGVAEARHPYVDVHPAPAGDDAPAKVTPPVIDEKDRW